MLGRVKAGRKMAQIMNVHTFYPVYVVKDDMMIFDTTPPECVVEEMIREMLHETVFGVGEVRIRMKENRVAVYAYTGEIRY